MTDKEGCPIRTREGELKQKQFEYSIPCLLHLSVKKLFLTPSCLLIVPSLEQSLEI